jgi:Dihaem cytochrome c
MLFDERSYLRKFAVIALLMGTMISFAHAEDDDDDRPVPVVHNALWQKECSDCHVAYPPRMLPAASWRAIMAGLDKHFGNDASLDEKSTREIAVFLEKHAGRDRHASSGKPVLRITETRWFRHEHDEVSARTWKNPKVKSPANCAACHIHANSGRYSEHDIRIPR